MKIDIFLKHVISNDNKFSDNESFLKSFSFSWFDAGDKQQTTRGQSSPPFRPGLSPMTLVSSSLSPLISTFSINTFKTHLKIEEKIGFSLSGFFDYVIDFDLRQTYVKI